MKFSTSAIQVGFLIFGVATTNGLHLGCWGTATDKCDYGIQGSEGAVVSEVGSCSEIGIDILRQGGNAADAAIASGLCIGVMAGYHSGLGGGGFMLVRSNTANSSHAYEMIDFRETMPEAGNETTFSAYGPNQTRSTVGGLAVGVPGELRGWETLHQRHGSLPWATLFQPAIEIARKGFPVFQDLADYIYSGINTQAINDTNWLNVFAPNGTALNVNDTCYRPSYADTLQRIAESNADVLYRDSSIAENIVARIQDTGGIMTNADLEAYEAIIREPVMANYRGRNVISTVAPSSGAIVLSALNVFQGFDVSPEDDLATHLLIESTKFAYGQRAELADPAFVTNVSAYEKDLFSPEIVDAVRAKITANATHPSSYYEPRSYLPTRESGTSHLAVVDKDGMTVSLTTTVNAIWGARIMTDDGILLNDEMDDFGSPGLINSFGFASSPANFIQGGKRPLSSIASTMVEDGETGQLLVATGAAGGSQIITATLQNIYNYIDGGLNATQISLTPKWHDQLGGKTMIDRGNATLHIDAFSNATAEYLLARGHNITLVPTGNRTGSTSHVIGRLPGGDWLASADPKTQAGYGAAY